MYWFTTSLLDIPLVTSIRSSFSLHDSHYRSSFYQTNRNHFSPVESHCTTYPRFFLFFWIYFCLGFKSEKRSDQFVLWWRSSYHGRYGWRIDGWRITGGRQEGNERCLLATWYSEFCDLIPVFTKQSIPSLTLPDFVYQSTRLITSSEDDTSPIIMVWDLRNSRAPEKVSLCQNGSDRAFEPNG